MSGAVMPRIVADFWLQITPKEPSKKPVSKLPESPRKIVAGLKALPFLPEVIGVVTSPTGAVIRDILHRLSDRFPRHVLVWPVLVQGEGAAQQVTAAIQGFNRIEPGGAIPRPDLLIVARGGGSLPARAMTMSRALGPLTRMTAMADRPAPVARAKIVSRRCEAVIPLPNRYQFSILTLRNFREFRAWPGPPPSGIHRIEEIAVGLGLAQLIEQELDGIDGSHRIEDPP